MGKRILSYVFSTILAAAIIAGIFLLTKRDTPHHEEIDGIVNKWDYVLNKNNRSKDYVLISTNGGEYKLILTPIAGEAQFYEVVQAGDRIYSRADGDTLFLYHQDKKLKYFAKPFSEQ
ncbi:MAG TPA: hypothetical protein VHE59_21090 [Mucilaginibacter sp.]|nr:hypothetical protein [Mucilaginibacter sp.]